MIFKDNSGFILPIITDTLPIPIKNITNVEISSFNGTYIVSVFVKNFKLSEKALLGHRNFYNVIHSCNEMIINYLVPENLLFVCRPIIKHGYDFVTKDILFDCIRFWKEISFLALNANTQATPMSDLGIFYLSICII